MIHVFCGKRGSGKTKALINIANEKVLEAKGNVVYIDDDDGPYLILNRRIRFINTSDFGKITCGEFYGFLCGIISEDYDIDNIFIDGLFNIVDGNLNEASYFFCKLEKLALKNNVEFYININGSYNDIPEYMRKYISDYALV